MSYIRNTNPGFGHFERQRFGGMGSSDFMFGGFLGGVTAYAQAKKSLSSSVKGLWDQSGIGTLWDSDPSWNPATAYRNLLELQTRLHTYNRWTDDAGVVAFGGWGGYYTWLVIEDMITKMMARIPASVKRSISTADRAVIVAHSAETEIKVQKAAAKAPAPPPEKSWTDTATDFWAEQIGTAMDWGTGPDEQGQYKEEELEREQAKAEAAKAEAAKAEAVAKARKEAITVSPGYKIGAPKGSTPAKPEPGFWESITGGFTGGFKSTASFMSPRASTVSPGILEMIMGQPKRTSQPQTIIMQKKSDNTALYIGLGVGASVLLIVGVLVMTRKKTPTVVV